MSQISQPFNPYRYPPDFILAKIHQSTTMPGKPDKEKDICKCCKQYVKKPFTTWWNRSIQKDFSQHGGAVVSYFWLLKLYIIATILVLAVYGIYLQYLSSYYCDQLKIQILKQQICKKLFGIWMITNEDLYNIIDLAGDHDVIVRFSTLRSIVFVIFLFTNIASLYLMKWFKKRYPDKVDVSNFSLIFKNNKFQTIQKLVQKLKNQNGQFQIKQAFNIKKMQPFYLKYKQKILKYYQCKNQDNSKTLLKKIKQLQKIDSFCSQHQNQCTMNSNRAIIVFNSQQFRNKILQKYKISSFKKIYMFLNDAAQQQQALYCQPCPRPQQIYWHNIGKIQSQGFKLKITSSLYFIITIVLLGIFLYLIADLIYLQDISQPFRTILQNILLFIIVVIALTFRRIMDYLSDRRYPNTYTNRTMFIIITTVTFHFIFYLWIPSFYLKVYNQKRASVLALMSNQAIMTVIVQILMSYLDFFFCMWQKRKKKIQNQEKPFAPQKLIHEALQYPRFPLEFKIIVLFKFWSLMSFFGFHSPLVLFFVLIALVFLYVKDKFNLYKHYKIQIIQNQVQFSFLRIYTIIFTGYMYIIFVYTQKHPIQYIIGGIVTGITITFQLFYFRNFKDKQVDVDQLSLITIDDIRQTDLKTLYKEKYEQFLQHSTCQQLDIEIKQYLSKSSSSQITKSWSINQQN